MDEQESEQQAEPMTSAAESFSLLSDDVRLSIIDILDERAPERPSFSTLQEAVGVEDSGQFNYHLSKLVGQFVSKTEAGYGLTAAGQRLTRAVRAGLYTGSPELEPFEIEGECQECAARALEAAYANETVEIACTACGYQPISVDAPPSLIRGRTPEEAIDAFEEWSFRQVEQARSGLCPYCGGAVEKGITDQTPEELSVSLLPEIICTVCSRRTVTSFEAIARGTDVVQAFHDRHGYNHVGSDRRYWEFEEPFTDDNLELTAESPPEVTVTFRADDQLCEVVIDENLSVVRTTVRAVESDES